MSSTDDYGTPQWLYNELNKEFGFTIDACASVVNHKHERYWTQEQDCKKQDWTDEVVFINPPYSQPNIDQIVPYCAQFKAWVVVAIIPATPNTKWFHKHIWDGVNHRPRKGVEIRFPSRRIAFEHPTDPSKNSPRHDSMIVVWSRTEAEI